MKTNVMNLNRPLATRLAWYKAHIPTHGKTLGEVIRAFVRSKYAFAGSLYTSHILSAGWNGTGNNRIRVWTGFPQVQTGRTAAPCDFINVCGLRCVGAADQLQEDGRQVFPNGRNGATGYYADGFQHSVIVPLVFALPKSRGFLRGYYCADTGEVILLSGIEPDARAAFWAAHSYAESLAESEREEDAKWQAEQRIEDLRAENTELRELAVSLISEMRTLCGLQVAQDFTACRTAVQRTLTVTLNTLDSNRAAIAELKENPWAAVA